MLQNRRFYVILEGKKRSVLASVLFEIYSNDQPTPEHTNQFLYVDDLGMTAQGKTFEEVEVNLENTLNDMV